MVIPRVRPSQCTRTGAGSKGRTSTSSEHAARQFDDRGFREPRRGPRGRRAGARGFWSGTRGGTVIESAISISILVISFAVLAEIVHDVYKEDKLARAARAAARAIALNPAADPCAAIRSELDLADDFNCAGSWTVDVDRGVSPATLPKPLDADVVAGTGDLVLVRIGWNRDPWSYGGVVRDANAADGSGDDSDGSGTVPVMAMGVARCEFALCSSSGN